MPVKTAKSTPKTKRIRRTPEDAKALILDAAESAMTAGGPSGLRLQDVAKKAGVSHPTILHHFGSREGLVRALNVRAVHAVKTTVISHMGPGDEGLRATFAAYRGGLAQRMLWLMQAGDTPAPNGLSAMEEIVAAVHAERIKQGRPSHPPDMADTRAIVHLVVITAFGDALIGPRMRQTPPGPKDQAGAEKFEKWFGELLMIYFRAKG